MTRSFLCYDAPGSVLLQREPLPDCGPDQVRVDVRRSLISVGSELLVLAGKAPAGERLDDSIDALRGGATYPLRYGYACVGVVEETGSAVRTVRAGERVFAFHPHASSIVVPEGDVIPVPADLSDGSAVLYPAMETALTFAHDGAPLPGEAVLVVGLGLVGQLLLFLLTMGGAALVVGVDWDPARREATAAFLPGPCEIRSSIESAAVLARSTGVDHPDYPGFDVVFETSGNPEALNAAIGAAGFEGTLIVGSWYGRKRASLDLGGRFHRGRLTLRSSQVSTIAGAVSARWTRRRRTSAAWRFLRDERIGRIETHTVSLAHAPALYRDLAAGRRDATAYTITYDEERP